MINDHLPYRRPPTNLAALMQKDRLHHWREECQTGPSTRQFRLNGRPTGVVEASPTAEDVTGAVTPRAFQVALTRPTDWKLAYTIGHLSDPCQPSSEGA